MPKTYDPIATYTAPSAQTSYTFSSISAAYTDLIIVINGNTNNNTSQMTFNSDTSAVYSRTVLRGDGTSATSFRQSGAYIAIDGSYSQPFQNVIIHVMNYSNTTTFKTALSRSNNAGAGIDQLVGLWRSTVAINAITFLNASNYSIGTTFTLYGIKAA